MVRGHQVRHWTASFAVLMLAGVVAMHAGDGLAQGAAQEPELVFAPTQGLGGFDGFGVQFNQHVYAKISGPPQGLPQLESR